MITKSVFVLGVSAFALGFAAAPAGAAAVFTIKSSTFADGKIMPKKVANSTANIPNNPNCVGENVSPQLSWTNVPDGTKSFAMLMFDPEGRAPGGVSHWVRLWHPGIGHRLYRRRAQQGFGQICRRQELVWGRALFRTLPATEHPAAPLFVRTHRDRF